MPAALTDAPAPQAASGPGRLACLRERRLFRRRCVVVPEERLEWYRGRFGPAGIYSPRAAAGAFEAIADKSRRKVFRLPAVVAGGDDPGRRDAPRAERSPGAPGGIVLKEERFPFPTFLKGLFTEASSVREFRNLLALRALGFPVVEPLAHGVSGLGPFTLETFLITREFAGATDLRDWIKERCGLTPDEVEARVMGLAVDLARLHVERRYLRTFYAKNLLVRRAPGGGLDLALCDVPRLTERRGRPLSFRLAAGDLASLEKWGRCVFSPRVRLLFLRRYLEALGEGPPARRWVAAILRRVERMRHRTFLGALSKRFKRWLRRRGLSNYWPF